MKKLILIFSILFQFGFVNAQLSGTYQIGINQPFPFNTITNAVNNISTVGVSGAVTFLLTDSLYEESGIEFITVPGTSVTNTITLRPANGVDVEIKGNGDFVFGIDRTSHLFFEGKSLDNTGSLTITSTETVIGSSVIKATTPINTAGNTLNIHISNCTINAAPPFFSEKTEPKTYCFNFPSTNNNVHTDSIILSNNIFRGGDFSIHLIDNSISKITYKITDNQFISAGSIAIVDAASVGTSCIIQGNSFEYTNLAFDIELSIIYIFGGLNININNNLFNGINYNFLSFKLDASVFNFSGIQNIKIYNNIIKNINYNAPFALIPNLVLGPLVNFFKFTVNENVKFYHNSVYIPFGNENGFLSAENVSFSGFKLNNNQNLDIKNNIFAFLQGNKPGETVNSTARVYEFNSATDITTLQSDNNIYFVDNHTNNYFYTLGSSNYDFNQWQTTYPTQDQNSYWEMPNVISKDDLHLSQDCNRGTPIALVPLDFEGVTRSTLTPDIGAYEYITFTSFEYIGTCQLMETEFNVVSTTQIQSALWNFGDSQTSTELEPVHTYTNAGTYTVTLTVTYIDNTTKTISKQITIYDKPTQTTILHD